MSVTSSKTNAEQITRDSILKIGNVISIAGRTVRVRVDKAKNVSHLLFNGETIKNISVGGYIKIRKGFEVIVGKIEGEQVNERIFEVAREYVDKREKVDRILEIKLVGFYDSHTFKKGIKELPLIDNECFLLSKTEYSDVHQFVDPTDIPLEIGVLANDPETKISIGVNALFASHVGIFGNTGSGKSYTLASLYSHLLRRFSTSDKFKTNARFVLLDFNGEYVASNHVNEIDSVITSPELKTTYTLSTKANGQKYPMSPEAIADELLWIIAAEATDKTQAPFLRRSLKNRFIEDHMANSRSIIRLIGDMITSMGRSKNREFLSVIHNLMKDLEAVFLDHEQGFETARAAVIDKIHYFNQSSEFYVVNSTGAWVYGNQDHFSETITGLLEDVVIDLPAMSLFQQIHAKIILNFYLEVSKGYSNREHIAPMMKRLEKRVDDLSKVIQPLQNNQRDESLLTVISLKDVNIHMRKVLPLLICKELYEEKKANSDKSKYLNLIIDEAHNILSDESLRESEQWKDYRLETFEEIIKEGRKFGTFLTISSQRPYDISPTIISQLHNYFLHRLVNENDLKAIQNTVSFLDKVSFESLPILPTGACVVSGLVSQVPVVVQIGRLPAEVQPVSNTYRPTDFWESADEILN